MPLFAEVGQAFVQDVWLRAVERELRSTSKNVAVQYGAIGYFTEPCEQVLIAIAIKNPLKQGDGSYLRRGCALYKAGAAFEAGKAANEDVFKVGCRSYKTTLQPL